MLLISAVLIGIALDFAGARPAEPAVKYYASKYDHIDVEAIINNRRMVNYYSACLLSKGPCPPEGVEFKRILPEALQTNCGRCTEKQATVALRAIKRLRKEYPKIWSQLTEKWDPDEIYVKKFESSFDSNYGGTSPPKKQQPAILSRFGEDDDEPTNNNNIGGSFTLTSTTSSTSHQDPTTNKALTTTNSIPSSSTISTSTTTDYPYPPYEQTSLVSTAKTTPKPSSSYTNSALTSYSTTNTPSSTTEYRTNSKSVTIISPSTTFRPSTTTTSSTKTSSSRTTTSSFSTTEFTISSTAGSRTTTRSPVIPGFIPLNTFFTNPPIPIRPLINLNIGANIGATVSGLVRGLGALGTRVMETGADIAEVVIKNFARPFQV